MDRILLTKEEFDELMKIKGEVRGVTLKGYGDYLLKKEGEEKTKEIEEIITDFGYPFRFKEVKGMHFYPVGLQAVILELMKRMFNYTAETFQEIGEFSAKSSILVRVFARYFFSVKEIMKRAPEMWRKSYTIGQVKLMEYNEEKRRLILRIENFKVHPLQGQVLIGYFSSVLQMIGGQKAKGEEIKSPFRGDECYEFLMEW